MARAYFSKKVTLDGVAVQGAAIVITDSETGSTVPAYSAKTGETAATLSTAVNGRFEVWLDEGTYDIEATYSGQVDTWLNVIVENRPQHTDISLDAVTGAAIAASGTGVFYGDVVNLVVGGVSTISGYFTNYTMDSDVAIDLSGYMTKIYSVMITRRDSGTSSDIPAGHSGTTVTINRNNDIAGDSQLYFEFKGEAV